MNPNPSLPRLFARLPTSFAEDCEIESPWLLLGDPLQGALDALPSDKIEIQLDPRINLSGDRIVIGKGCRIHPGATIEGPIRIGRNAEVGPGAVLRGGNWLGDDCVVGANSEIEGSILMDRSTAPHLNYIGRSILGVAVNLGAGAVLSNQPSNRRELVFGAILGDKVKIGHLCGLDPGTIIGRDSHLQSGIHLPAGTYPEASHIKRVQTLEIVDTLL